MKSVVAAVAVHTIELPKKPTTGKVRVGANRTSMGRIPSRIITTPTKSNPTTEHNSNVKKNSRTGGSAAKISKNEIEVQEEEEGEVRDVNDSEDESYKEKDSDE